MKKVAIVNGPNINLLGLREPEFYGEKTLDDIEKDLELYARNDLKIDLMFLQSNHEGIIVEFIQNNYQELAGVVINPAAFSKTGYSILEALIAVKLPFVEVHLSNIFAREKWHGESIFLSSAIGQVIGFQSDVYELGLKALFNYIENK